MDAPTWEHLEDIHIKKPNSEPKWEKRLSSSTHVMYFDGGCSPKTKLGSGGYLLFAPDG